MPNDTFSPERAALLLDATSQLTPDWVELAGQQLLRMQQGSKGDRLHEASVGWAALLLVRFVESGHFDELLADVLQERTEAAGRLWGVDDTGLHSFDVQADENDRWTLTDDQLTQADELIGNQPENEE